MGLAILARIKDQISSTLKSGKEGRKKCSLHIADYLDPDLICFLNSTSRDEALGYLIDRLVENGALSDPEAFFQAILHREKIVSTGIGMGVAIPHAKLDSTPNFFIAIGIHEGDGVDWDALDGAPVRLIFLIGGPAHLQGEYLEILSKLTAVIRDEERLVDILSATLPSEVLKIFQDS